MLTGPATTALSKLSYLSFLTSVNPLIASYFVPHDDALQVPSFAVYSYSFSEQSPPDFSTYLNASSINPPLQPWLPSLREQSTNCCSDKVTMSSPVTSWRIAYRDSNEPVVENAQQLPHCS